MLRLWLYILAPTAIVVLILSSMNSDRDSSPASSIDTDRAAAPLATTERTSEMVELYFANKDFTDWHVQRRSIDFGNDVSGKVAALVGALKRSDRDDQIATLPTQLTPNNIFVDAEKILYLNFTGTSMKNLKLGPTWERFMLGAIVLTLLHNIEDVRAVKFLVEGNDSKSFGGSLLTLRPLNATNFLSP